MATYTKKTPSTALAPVAPASEPAVVNAIAQIADQVSSRHAFDDYRSRKANNTRERQDDDLQCFANYLGEIGIQAGDLSHDADAWSGITFGIVEGFVKWQLRRGSAIGTINVRLSTVKTYSGLASKAKVILPEAYALIRLVKGYRRSEAKRVDADRPVTRLGDKKAEATSISRDQVSQLLSHPSTPQGRRDAVLMGLLLKLGLRVGEVVGLKVPSVDLKAGTLTFYRPKVDKVQTHRLPRTLLTAMRSYFSLGDAPAAGSLLRRSLKNGRLGKVGLTRSGIAKRVRDLGKDIGLSNLSPHDCRHYWATNAARHKTPIDRLKDGGGWSSVSMPMRYIEDNAIANEGVVVEEPEGDK